MVMLIAGITEVATVKVTMMMVAMCACWASALGTERGSVLWVAGRKLCARSANIEAN